MTKSRDGSSGCFFSIVRLLLCKGSLQTHPSDQIAKPNTTESVQVIKDSTPANEVKAQAPRAPGVVAKLMGLDSLPDTNWFPKGRTSDSVSRCRSLNSMDYLLEFDLVQAQHRRLRKCVSFREGPTVVNRQSQDFFGVCLNAVEKANKLSPIRRKSEMGFAGLKKIKNEKKSKKTVNPREAEVTEKKKNQGNMRMISKLKGEASERRGASNKQSSRFVVGGKEAHVLSSSASPCRKVVFRKSDEKSKRRSSLKPKICQKEVFIESKLMKRTKNKPAIKNGESPDRDSQDSCPVSVLWINEFHEKSAQSFDDTIGIARPRKLNTKKSSTNCNCILTSHPSRISNTCLEPRVLVKSGCGSSENLNVDYCIELGRKLCRMTETAIEELNCTVKNLSETEEFEDICAEFGQTILDQLMNRVVEELTE